MPFEGEIVIPYKPRAPFVPYHERQQRFAIIVAHRRAGKTVAEVNECIRKCLSVERQFPPPQVAFVSPTYSMAKRNAWEYVRYYASPIPGVKFLESELTAIFPNGAKLMLVGSDRPDRLRGIYLDHAALDEFGDQVPRVWGEIIRPALSDYAGSATFIGTPKGRNHFYRLLKVHENDPDWYVSILRASQTGIIPPEELEHARRTMTPEQYAQEYECSFDAEIRGAFYADLILKAEQEGRITNVPHDPAANVFAAWDLGIDDATAIWVGQFVGKEIHWIDYIEDTGHGIDYYLDVLSTKPYPVHAHILPHDAQARELSTGVARTEVFRFRGQRFYIAPRLPIADGINAVRIAFNRFWFDKNKCERGLDALRMYRVEWDDNKQTPRSRPVHDWTSHAADAMRYAIVGQGLIAHRPETPKWQRRAVI